MYIFKIMYVLGRVPQHIVEALKHEALNRLTLFFFFFTILCVHVCTCAGEHTHLSSTECAWRSEDNVQELTLSFHCVGPGI